MSCVLQADIPWSGEVPIRLQCEPILGIRRKQQGLSPYVFAGLAP